ncbi:enterochelin esterase-like enzyme [Paenarthrobacter nicotinovorans]|uniref:Enterochelin esterase-like enzyme n=1 Tax=Paenarthrobacter nicotinovorans TaxID=29320 RepID=A0ABT9TKS2_PAENI|nr:alpha/beta hydrolase-fold protein [Paenarthrobacter nicotinovorans]MDQ0101222.1 enterochelin esterase-like enzyme [Paenarthrobacter nicotinovorans]
MDFLLDVSLVSGPFLWFSIICGVAGAAYLLWRRKRSWFLLVPASLLASIGLVTLVHWILVDVLAAFSENLPFETVAWSVPAVAAVLLCAARFPRNSWKGRGFSTLAMLGVILLSAVQVNLYFGLNNTVADLLGTAVARIQPLEQSLKRSPGSTPGPLASAWKAPESMPSNGILRKAAIPGSVSGFSAREAYIYFPPAYQTTPRPVLPVLVLFSGQPGGPADWLTGGQLRAQMDRFAVAHQGISPVTVVVDPNGSGSANTMCMDSRIAPADTFLSKDVPAWISENLDVSTDHKQWAVGGFSFGGTCALQMGTAHPDIFPSVLAFSAEREPALAKDRNKTIADSFDGDVAAFESRTPLALMGERTFAGSGVYFAAGATDNEFTNYMHELAQAAASAGFQTEEHTIRNAGHSWDAVVRGMPGGLDFLATRWGLRK